MIRAISIIATACAVIGVALLLIDIGGYFPVAIPLILISLLLGGFLAVRRILKRVGEIVAAAHAFVTGDVRHARILEVGEPKGLFNPTAETILEVVGEGEQVHRINVEMPVPLPAALAYRLARRWNVPVIGRRPLSELMAVELRREGLKMDLGWRPPPQAPVIDHTVPPSAGSG